MKNQDPVKTSILQYAITFGACLLLCFIYCWIEGIFKDYVDVVEQFSWNINNNTSKVFFILTNGCFTIGILCTCVGFFIIASNGGMFDMLIYGVGRFFSLFKKDPTRVRFKTFYDYRMYKSEEPKKSFGFFLVIGLSYILFSLLFLWLYYRFN